MDTQDILNFRESVKNFTVEELEAKHAELQDEISKMILNSDTVIKAAIIENLLQQKKGK